MRIEFMMWVDGLPQTEVRIVEAMRQQDSAGWIRQVEEFVTSLGARAQLQHVDWSRHYASNEDAYSSVLTELEKMDI